MSGLHILLPVKPPALGKSRLAGRLAPRQRLRLNLDLFERTLASVMRFAGSASVLVISRDPGLLAMAVAAGSDVLAERGPGGLNAALEQALAGLDAEAVLVVPADLPLLSTTDLAELVKPARVGPRPAVALAPDLSGRGTNALLMAPPGIVPFRFGPGSFAAHVREARRVGIEPRVVRRAGLAFDLDTAADYDELLRRPEAAAAIGAAPLAV